MLLSPIDFSKKAEMITLWNNVIGQDFPIYDRLFMQNTIEDPHLDTGASRMAYSSSGKVIGFILCKKGIASLSADISEQNGYIQALAVDPAYQKTKVATHLLEHAENVFRQANLSKIIVGQDIRHYFPGVPVTAIEAIAFFEGKGYQKKELETDLLLMEAKKPPGTVPPEVNVSLLTLHRKKGFLDFLEDHFPGRWAYEAHDYFQHGGTGREYLIMEKDEEIIGFCRINDDASPIIGPNVYWKKLFDQPIGGIGPLGIQRSERGNGYGLLIVAQAMNYLIEREITALIIDWTTHIEFYQKLGFQPWKKYQTFEKKLSL